MLPAANNSSNATLFWDNLTASVGTPPSDRSISQEAYSPALNETILFGGYNGAGGNFALGDTWEYSHGQWTELQASGGPSPRWGSSFVYDAADGYLLLFGGRDANQTFNDTWMYNATGWHEINTTSAPSARFDPGVAYDAADGYVVLFGGVIGNVPAGTFTGFVFYNDTWTYRAGVWTNITATAGAAPAARRSHQQMTYDVADGYVLLTGGFGVQPVCYTNWSIPAYAETWTFVGGQWAQVTPTGASPPQGMGAVWYDSQANETLYYLAMENLTADACPVYSGGVWSYAAGSWTLLTNGNASGPTPRILSVAVDDVGDQQQILFGGESEVSEAFGVYLSDTWSFCPNGTSPPPFVPSNSTWQNVTEYVGVAPSDRSISQLAYSPALNETILFGGYNGAGGNFALGDTWEYSHGQWTELQASGGPSPRWGSSFVYDAADGYLLLFGGRDANQIFNDTWMYNATGWHEINTTSAPSVRFDSGVAYDAADGYVVLFGGAIGNVPAGSFTGFVFYNDTWTYRAGVWANITATAGAAPAARRSHQQMTYDAVDGYVLLTGGYATQPLCGTNWSIPAYAETWTFVGGQWTQLIPTGGSPPPGMGGVWFDSQANETLYYVGMENSTASGCPEYLGEVWSYSAGTWSVVTDVNISAPAPRILSSFVDDIGDHEQIMFGGELDASEYYGVYLSDTWLLDPNGSPPGVYAVVIQETGLPAGTTWSAALGRTVAHPATSAALFSEPNGTYSYLVRGPAGYIVSGVAHAGRVTVKGTTVTETVHFAKGSTRTLAFHATGLIPGTSWCVTVGYQVCSTKATIAFKNLTPAAYSFSISGVSNYSVVVQLGRTQFGASGTAELALHGVTYLVKFVPNRLAVTFDQTGLGSNVAWHVKATCTAAKRENTGCYGMTASAGHKGYGITLLLRNGTYTWTVRPIRGYELEVNGVIDWSGTVAVNGTAITLNLTFVRIAPAGATGSSGGAPEPIMMRGD
jgi:hypothetical protein